MCGENHSCVAHGAVMGPAGRGWGMGMIPSPLTEVVGRLKADDAAGAAGQTMDPTVFGAMGGRHEAAATLPPTRDDRRMRSAGVAALSPRALHR